VNKGRKGEARREERGEGGDRIRKGKERREMKREKE